MVLVCGARRAHGWLGGSPCQSGDKVSVEAKEVVAARAVETGEFNVFECSGAD
jgi:hypothetical protein